MFLFLFLGLSRRAGRRERERMGRRREERGGESYAPPPPPARPCPRRRESAGPGVSLHSPAGL